MPCNSQSVINEIRNRTVVLIWCGLIYDNWWRCVGIEEYSITNPARERIEPKFELFGVRVFIQVTTKINRRH